MAVEPDDPVLLVTPEATFAIEIDGILLGPFSWGAAAWDVESKLRQVPGWESVRVQRMGDNAPRFWISRPAHLEKDRVVPG